jgi:hypothetical protein
MDPDSGQLAVKSQYVLNGPAFDLSRCVGSFNTDGSASLTLAWSPVPNATRYKVIQGGKSGIVLNSMFLKTYIDQTGCFESIVNSTTEIKEYLTQATTYTLSYPVELTYTNIHQSFLVYAYFGKKRGAAPYGILLIDIVGALNPLKYIFAQIRSNISVSLVKTDSALKYNKYEYFNHYSNKKDIINIVPDIATLDQNGLDTYKYERWSNSFGSTNYNVLERATLFCGVISSEYFPVIAA